MAGTDFSTINHLIHFFVDPAACDLEAGEIHFDHADSHHIAVVLRKRIADHVVVLDGKGAAYLSTLVKADKKSSVASIIRQVDLATEPGIAITIVQSLPKTREKLEWVLQHGTEAGASSFILTTSAQGRNAFDGLASKVDRWIEIVRTASEQAHRMIMPTLLFVESFTDAIREARNSTEIAFIASPEATQTVSTALPDIKPLSVSVIIGPELGFTQSEFAIAKTSGFELISLGNRILRTETAALIAISNILYHYSAS